MRTSRALSHRAASAGRHTGRSGRNKVVARRTASSAAGRQVVREIGAASGLMYSDGGTIMAGAWTVPSASTTTLGRLRRGGAGGDARRVRAKAASNTAALVPRTRREPDGANALSWTNLLAGGVESACDTADGRAASSPHSPPRRGAPRPRKARASGRRQDRPWPRRSRQTGPPLTAKRRSQALSSRCAGPAPVRAAVKTAPGRDGANTTRTPFAGRFRSWRGYVLEVLGGWARYCRRCRWCRP